MAGLVFMIIFIIFTAFILKLYLPLIMDYEKGRVEESEYEFKE